MSGSVGWKRIALFWTIALGGAAFDLATKSLVFSRVGQPGSPPVTLIPNMLELHTSYNTGALWGLGRSIPHSSLIFASLSVIAACAILYYLFVIGAAADRKLTIALALIMAGALGNCHDRIMLRQVRDFVHFHIDAIGFDCAIFNFADNMLVIGALMIMFLAIRAEPVEPAESGLEKPVTSA